MTIQARTDIDPAPVTVDTLQQLQTQITGTPAGQQLRVVGAGHSVPAAIGVDPGRGVNISLGTGFLNAGVSSWTPPIVVGEGGMRLGGDPDQNVPPTAGLLYFMSHNRIPWSVPDLGGISHQTVGGFLSTGSSGGSLTYAFEDAVDSVTIVDGTGTQRVFEGDGSTTGYPLAAAGASLGLLGVIAEVSLTPVDRFGIAGQESTSEIDKAAFQPFSSGTDGLAEFLQAQEYCRIMWWPQKGVDKLVTWTAKRVPLPADPSTFVPSPYRELGDPDENPAQWPDEWPELLGNVLFGLMEERDGIIALYEQVKGTLPEDMVQFLEQIVQTMIDESPMELMNVLKTVTLSELNQFGVDLYFSLLGNRKTSQLGLALFTDIFKSETQFESHWSPVVMNGIFLIDDAAKVKPGAQTFLDYGDTGLPMDDQISDYLMPTEFTELWVPIERTADVMTTLRDFYAAGGYDATGTYACELYAAKQSKFWMSPATAGDVLRVDVFWFARNGDQTPQQFYGPFWDLLRKANIPFRPHWGKYLPPVSSYGPAYYGPLYPHLPHFLALRAQLDPRQIFVNDYWRSQLGIPTP